MYRILIKGESNVLVNFKKLSMKTLLYWKIKKNLFQLALAQKQLKILIVKNLIVKIITHYKIKYYNRRDLV